MDRATAFSTLIHDIATHPHVLERRPEPRAITDNEESVQEYDRVLSTNITVNYAASLDIIHRTRSARNYPNGGAALDLCSGPGHVSLFIAKHLNFKSVTGVDFSQPMVNVANKNAMSFESGSQIDFRQGNILRLEKTVSASYDLISFTNAAHHLDSIADVRTALTSAEALCKDDGTIVVTDLCRLNTARLTERFVELTGEDYLTQKMNWMYDDFLASMYAAWSVDEFARAIPADSKRTWYQIVMAHLPFFQALVAVPKGNEALFMRSSLSWESHDLFRSETARQDWQTMKDLIYSGTVRCLNGPRKPNLRVA